MRFAPLLLTKLFCDVINREAGREGGCGKDTISRQFPPSDVDSDLTTLGIAEQDCANVRDNGFSDKRHSSAKYNSNRTKGNVQFYVGQGFKVSLPFSS